MLRMECPAPELTLTQPDKIEFGVVKAIPEGMGPALESAVKDFIKASHTPKGVDIEGFYYQTLSAMANSTILGQGGELWLGTVGGELSIYILSSISNDIDGKLCYFVSQAWVREDQRGQKWVRWAWQRVRDRAKNLMCKHLMIASSRENDAAYCRFLGKGFHKYVTYLKEEF